MLIVQWSGYFFPSPKDAGVGAGSPLSTTEQAAGVLSQLTAPPIIVSGVPLSLLKERDLPAKPSVPENGIRYSVSHEILTKVNDLLAITGEAEYLININKPGVVLIR